MAGRWVRYQSPKDKLRLEETSQTYDFIDGLLEDGDAVLGDRARHGGGLIRPVTAD